MSRLIDADELIYESIDSCDTGYHESKYGTGIVAIRKEDIDEAPTIDAMEVVRCKDCKFWQDQEEGVVEVPICARPENKYEKHPFRFIIGKDGFCSYAERRSNEHD